MSKGRMEAFSDGVMAVIITLMVLELRAPRGIDFAALRAMLPAFLTYVLSFVFIGIYWNNHHHLLHAVSEVDGRILWSNLHLLFWLSLVPFVTERVGQSHFAAEPVALYGFVLLMAGVAYYVLARALIRHHGPDSPLALALGRDVKGKASVAIYLLAVPFAFVNRWIAMGAYVAVALMWLAPDPRIEKRLAPEASREASPDASPGASEDALNHPR